MRTTIRLDEDLLNDAKREAAASGQTFTRLVEEALREKLARRRAKPTEKRYVVHTFTGAGVRPGIDLTNNAALFELMDEEDAAS